jgi:general secretion pathway protein K
MTAGPLKQDGFVLLNALVLVAAFAAAAVVVLERATRAHQRQSEMQNAQQSHLYLDAFEVLAMAALTRDQQGGVVDHLREPWAQIGKGGRDRSMALDRGEISGHLVDMQGKFNVNWLANPGDLAAVESFGRLVAHLGLSERLTQEIVAFVSPKGPKNQADFNRMTPAIIARGGPVMFVDQLRVMPTLSDRDYARLRPFLTALPSDSQINLNTVSAEVLAGFLPDSNVAGLRGVLTNRSYDPYTSVDDFMLRAAVALPGDGVDGENEMRFSIGSSWFRGDISVDLGGRIRTRQTFFYRQSQPFGPQVAFRLEGRP